MGQKPSRISARGRKLEEVPKAIWKHAKHLTELDLGYNNIATLPKNRLATLQSLTDLQVCFWVWRRTLTHSTRGWSSLLEWGF